jgi:hypothetical protein
MSELSQGLAQQFIDFIEAPDQAQLDTLLCVLQTIMSNERERSCAEHILRRQLALQQAKDNDLNVQSP